MSLIQHSYVLSRRENRDTQGEGHVTTEVETGAMHLQAKECQGLSVTLETERKHGRDFP